MDNVSTVDYDRLYTDILETKCYLHLSPNRVNISHVFLLYSTRSDTVSSLWLNK
jgi:hypothetical protein